MRRWLRFSLRTLLVFFVLASVTAGWVGSQIRQYETEQAIIAEIHASKVFRSPITLNPGYLMPELFM